MERERERQSGANNHTVTTSKQIQTVPWFFHPCQVCKGAQDYLSSVCLGELPAVEELKTAVDDACKLLASAHAQYIEAGFVYAVRHLRESKSKDKKAKKEEKKDATTMKQVLTDLNTKLVSGEHGVRSHMICKVLLAEATKHL